MAHDADPSPPTPEEDKQPEVADPVLERRERWRALGSVTQRLGYLLLGFATIVFFVGLVTGFDGTVVTIIVFALVAGSVVLAFGIQVQYAIRGAQRHEEDARAQRRPRR